MPMEIAEAKSFVNQSVVLDWTDRRGEVVSDTAFVYEVNFVPFYGPCLITNLGEIRLDRVVACVLEEKRAAA